jgi:thiol-disulfide isomerase/thioredoxin
MKLKKRISRMFLSGFFCLALLAGCGSEGNNSAEEGKNEKAPSAEADSLQEPLDSGKQETMGSMENIGEFAMEDIEGNSFTQEMFADYDLTMVNVFTTWCTPCVNEIPDLQELSEEVKEQGVNIVGIVLDAANGSGNADPETVEQAKLLAEKTGATYPFLIPDAGYLGGRLAGINAVPETFFVDKEGNIVGETYSGSRSLEEWREIVEKERGEAVP